MQLMVNSSLHASTGCTALAISKALVQSRWVQKRCDPNTQSSQKSALDQKQLPVCRRLLRCVRLLYLSALFHVTQTHLLQHVPARQNTYLDTSCHISLDDGAIGSQYPRCATSTWCRTQLRCTIPRWSSNRYVRYHVCCNGNLCRLATFLEDKIREAPWPRRLWVPHEKDSMVSGLNAGRHVCCRGST